MQADPSSRMRELAAFYRKLLLDDVMAFWEARTRDRDCGGYLTCFDRTGATTSTDKYIWFQGRQLWMFAALYNRIEKRDTWLDLAAHGRKFILAHAYAGKGRWHYRLDRAGGPIESTISIFTDLHVLEGLCEYAVARGHDDDMQLIAETYDTVERNVHDPDFKDIFHCEWNPGLKHHAIPLIALSVARAAAPVLGAARTRPLIDHCLNEILHVFAMDEYGALFESVSREGRFVDSDNGRLLNPGHALESMGFCAEEALERKDRATLDRALTVCDWMYARGYDSEHGGILSFVDCGGGVPKQADWFRETGLAWDDKTWWVNAEALYTLALAAATTRKRADLDRFIDLHEWCRRNFHDPEYGEWYAELYRDGAPKLTDKGTLWKAAYHLPRSLMKIALTFESAAAGAHCDPAARARDGYVAAS